MDTLSSSFLLKFPLYLNVKSCSPPKKAELKVSSVGIEEKQETSITANTSSARTTLHKLVEPTEKRNPIKPSNQEQAQVDKKTKPSLLANIFKSCDVFISAFLDLPLRPSLDPKQVLSGNFAPVDELPPTPCEVVEGALPSSLDGSYIRNGPNPQFVPRGPYHLFDGDGMLHLIRISQGKATLCSRYVKTYKYTVEHDNGSPVFPSVFSSFNGFPASMARWGLTIARVLAGQFSPLINGFGLANTSVTFFGGYLFALGESDLPYALELTPNGDIITLDRHAFYSKPFLNMTAHPKIDPNTGEAFAFGYDIFPPFLTYFRINNEGIKQEDIPIHSLTHSSFIHDFAVTKNYAIFPDIQIVIHPMDIFRGRSPVGVDPAKIPRLGIIPRYAKDETDMFWIEVPGFNMLHAVNAWEKDDGEEIVIVASNVLSVEHALDRMDLIHLSLEKVEIKVKEKKVLRQPVSPRSLDFGVINPAYIGKKNRYVYAAMTAPMPKIAGVVKLDLSLLDTYHGSNCTVASRLYGQGCYGGEPFFVSREPNNPEAEEDDGYLVTYVHNENTGESRFLVMNAKSPDLEIVANVRLPGRVPYGFHGLFVPESDLKKLYKFS